MRGPLPVGYENFFLRVRILGLCHERCGPHHGPRADAINHSSLIASTFELYPQILIRKESVQPYNYVISEILRSITNIKYNNIINYVVVHATDSC